MSKSEIPRTDGKTPEPPRDPAGPNPPGRKSAWPLPSRFGEYRLLKKLGGGGSGEVFLAEHESLGRQVALKLIHPGSIHFPEAHERLLHEARAASRLDHPGICPVFDIGSVDGVPYLAMRHIEGETLSRWIAEARRSTGLPAGGPRSRAAVAQLVGLVEKVARTLYAAHQAGLIHRDIKPANIMVAPGGEPVILDFGLAQVEGVKGTTGTRFGGIVGTPDYVPPEQISGAGAPPDPQWDIYSLGVTLYEALALRTPFRAPTLEQLQRNILTGDYAPLRRINPAVPPDLEVVVSTALAREPGLRYRSALELAEDLSRVLDKKPILARKPGPLLKGRRWIQRHPLPAALFALLSLAFAVSLLLLVRVHHLNRQTEILLTRMRARGLASASAAAFSSNQKLGLLLAAAGVRAAPSPETLSQLSRVLAGLKEASSFEAPGTKLRGALPSPAGDRVLTWDDRGKARLWDQSGRHLNDFEYPDSRLLSAAFSPDQNLLLASLRGNLALLWEIETDRFTHLQGHTALITCALFSPSGRFVLTTSVDRTARLWDLQGNQVACLEGHERAVLCAAYSPAGDRIATGDASGFLRIWAPDGTSLHALEAHAGPLRALAFSPCGERIATGGSDKLARLWDREGRSLARFEGHEAELTALCFSPDGGELLTASSDLTARLWQLGGTCRRILQGPRMRILEIAFSPAGDRILLASQDQPVRLFDRQGRLVEQLSGPPGLVASAHFSREGTRLLIATQEGTARLWNLRESAVPSLPCSRGLNMSAALSPLGDAILTLDGPTVRLWDPDGIPVAVLEAPDLVYWAEFSPNGTRIATSGKRQESRLWSSRGELIAVLADQASSHRKALFSPDGQTLLTVGITQPPSLWDRDGQLLGLWSGPFPGPGSPVLFSPDGQLVAWADRSHRIHLTDPAGRVLVRLGQEPEGIPHLAWSPDGTLLGTVNESGRTRVWDRNGQLQADFLVEGLARGQMAFAQGGKLLLFGLQSGALSVHSLQGQKIRENPLHDAAITWLSPSQEGDRVLTACQDGSACLSRITGGEILTLDGHQGALRQALLFADGSRALTVGEDGAARIWLLQPEALLEQARRWAGRDFLPAERRRFGDLLSPEAGGRP